MKIKYIIKNEKGLTLMEMIVAIAVFLVVVIMSSNIFTAVMSGQKRSIAQQNTQENMRYVFEVLGKEIRQAQRSDQDCFGAGVNRVFNTAGGDSILYFKNEEDECVAYFLLDGVLVVRRGVRMASTTPEFLEISGLTFDVTDNLIIAGASARVQPRITIKMRAAARNETLNTVMLNMQTTISSRFYE